MKQDTPMQELINLIPDAAEIKRFISENDADEKMLDEWLWERIFKYKNWIEKEKQLVIDAYTSGFSAGKWQTDGNDNIYHAKKYYNIKYNSK